MSNSYATMYDIKTVAATFSPDTTYAQLGDTIKFIISIGHDAREITTDSYNTNVMSPFPGGFNFPDGTFEYELTEAKTYYFACSFHLASSQMKGVIIVSNPASINAINNFENKVTVYPNPAMNVLFVSLPESDRLATIQIHDLSGAVVLEVENINAEENGIDISNLKSGTYIVTIQSGERSKKMSLIKI